MAAPREIVALTPLPETYGFTKSVYGLYRRSEAVRQAASLGEALRVWEQ